MDKFDRIYELNRILASRRTPIPINQLRDRLECTRSSVYRLIGMMRDRMDAPIETDERGVYYNLEPGQAYELPGLWFAANELQALVVIQRFLAELGEGLLEEHFAPLAKRINQLTQHKRLNLSEVALRIRMPSAAARLTGPAFGDVVGATLQRRKLWIRYYARTTDQTTERTISPQRVTHYRECWYLDAWDEKRNAFRTFAIGKIEELRVLKDRAQDFPESQLDEHFASAYGIFSGKADKTAVLHFTKESARWVADETWHPQQESQHLADGTYELRFPYRESTELVMDITRYGPHVTVIAPAALREQVKTKLAQALAAYSSSPG